MVLLLHPGHHRRSELAYCLHELTPDSRCNLEFGAAEPCADAKTI